jgi:type IV secretion system protein TrbL
MAGAARGGGAVLSGASAAYRSGGLAGVAEAGTSAAISPLRRAAAAFGGRQAGEQAASTSAEGQPDWARRMKRAETIRHGASAVGHAVRSGDHGGGGSSVDLSEGER